MLVFTSHYLVELRKLGTLLVSQVWAGRALIRT
jgi:hypothetical protein